MSGFDGSVAIVTGGGSGIGRATALLFGARQAVVAVVDINLDSAQRTVDEIVAAGGQATAFQLDVADADAILSKLDVVETTLGIATVLVNCAGVLHVAPALETKIEDFDRLVTINLRSVFALSVEFARRLVKAGVPGAIVNVTSVHAALSEPNASAYTAAKGGIEAMSRTFASEWAQYGIRVNNVRPGATRTALTDKLFTPEVLRGLEARVPLRRPAEPDEIARAIAYLASSEASYTTGADLDVDGGYRMDGSLPGTEYR